jgi:serine/threonine protein kinase
VDKKIGPYTIVRLLGAGGMGQVYEAVHDQIQRRAAIKILHKRFANNKQIATRFVNEARAVNIVQHASLVSIYEFGQTPDGSAYIVMEYLDGQTLRQRLESSGGRLQPEVAMRLSRQIASALSAAHQKGIIHRDLKPVNIMIVPDPEAAGGERAKVLDFGLAKVMHPDVDGDGGGLTRTGTILGTPAYMAPEQCRSARSVDDKSDVYALGVMLYEMLSSDIPFDAETDAELLSMHMYKDPPPLIKRAPSVPEGLAALVERMLKKEQKDRPSASEVATELARLLAAAVNVPLSAMQSGPIASASVSGTQPAAFAKAPLAGRSHDETLVNEPAADRKSPANRPTEPGVGKNQRLARHGDAPTVAPTKRSGQAPAASGSGSGRWVIFVVLAVVVAGAGGGLVGWMRGREQVAPSVPRVVRWSLSSNPADAEVIGPDSQLLGRTPLSLERPRGTGTVSLVLRAPGYQEQRLSLPLDGDWVQTVTLRELPAAGAPDGSTGKAGAKDAPEAPAPPTAPPVAPATP